jgi:hypothetical protein
MNWWKTANNHMKETDPSSGKSAAEIDASRFAQVEQPQARMSLREEAKTSDAQASSVWGMRAPKSIQAFEDAHVGGVADLGDPEAKATIAFVPQYEAYKRRLQSKIRSAFGESFPVYRSLTQSEIDAWKNGDDMGSLSVSLDKGVAERFTNLAAVTDKNRKVVAMDITPEMVVMRGSDNERELVIDGNAISASDVRVVENAVNESPRYSQRDPKPAKAMSAEKIAAIAARDAEIDASRFARYSDDEVRKILDRAYKAGAPQGIIDTLETELDRREREDDDPSGGDDEPNRSNTGFGIEELMQQAARRGRIENLSPAQLGAEIRRDGDIPESPLATVSDAELGQEAYDALRAYEKRIAVMRNRISTRAGIQFMKEEQ